VSGRLGAHGEAARGLDHDVGAELAPGQLGRVGLGGDADALAVDDERVLLDLNRTRVHAVDRVVLEQVTQRPRVGQVVDADELDVGAVPLGGADDETSDTAEAVDAYTHGHWFLPVVLCGQLTRGKRPIRG
jgi:hypothetical protein